jgi:hypothetical protein
VPAMQVLDAGWLAFFEGATFSVIQLKTPAG